jgi:hypothetical protein
VVSTCRSDLKRSAADWLSDHIREVGNFTVIGRFTWQSDHESRAVAA